MNDKPYGSVKSDFTMKAFEHKESLGVHLKGEGGTEQRILQLRKHPRNATDERSKTSVGLNSVLALLLGRR